eukprot:gene5087-6331_t
MSEEQQQQQQQQPQEQQSQQDLINASNNATEEIIEEINSNQPLIEDIINSSTSVIKKNEDAPDQSLFDTDKNNLLLKNVHCRRCDCIIIASKNAKLVEKDIVLSKKKSTNEAEELHWMWFLEDMFQFENVAFTKNIQTSHKYLTCAECESEIIGIHYIDTKHNFITHDRVVYK